ncbi:MAG: hypothetical protein GXY49_03550 [Syntrophomonadaceae bacterium]|nr:hypothetical protein [Syntrophomonadaceae bacterium]
MIDYKLSPKSERYFKKLKDKVIPGATPVFLISEHIFMLKEDICKTIFRLAAPPIH